MRYARLLMAAPLLWAASAHATTMMPLERTCPVGGAKYPSFQIMSTSSMGMRLDLRPIGPKAHLPYIQCPNGFIVFKAEKDFTPDEIAKLTPVVESAAFQDALKNDVPSIRLAMLERAVSGDPEDIAYFLLKAAFEAEDRGDEALRRKHLGEAADAYAAFAASHMAPDKDWWYAQVQLAEIARQRGQFAQAIAVVGALAEPPADAAWLKDVAVQIGDAARAGQAEPLPYKSR